MDYTLDQLTTIVNSLLTRVNVLDGQNLPYNQTGALANITKQISSVQTDLGQIAATFESQLAAVKTQLASIQTQINTLAGQPAPSA